MTIHRLVISTAIGLLTATFCGCNDDGGSSPNRTAAGPSMVIPAVRFVEGDKPANTPKLTEVKAESNVGDKVMFEARVGGRADVFVEGMAIFVAADPRLISCDQREGDYCKIPWDYCCEHPGKMKLGTATVQIMDDAGVPYEVSAEGQGGIAPLKTIVVQGVVSEKDESGTFVVDASSIWVGEIPAHPPTEADHDHDHDHDHG